MSIRIDLGTFSEGTTADPGKRVVSINCTKELTGAEVLTGTPVVLERTTADLTITSKRINTSPVEVERVTVATNKAIQFFVKGATKARGSYLIDIACATTSTPDAEKLTYEGVLLCV